MSLFLIAITATVGASIGYLASRRRDAVKASDKKTSLMTTGNRNKAKKPTTTEAAQGNKNPLASFALGLGDVVSAEGEERWLAGAIVARDTGVVAAVYIAPEGLAHRAVVVFPKPEQTIQWLAPAEVTSPEEPPATLEIGGITMRRRARLPVYLDRLGQGTPNVGPNGVFAMYEAGGREAAVVITTEGRCFSWFGRRLEEGEYDRMGGGTVEES